MNLNFINSKPFFGTDSCQESLKVFHILQQFDIRCSHTTFDQLKDFKNYSGDPYHIYSEAYLKKLHKFYIVRVHRRDFQKALELYDNYD